MVKINREQCEGLSSELNIPSEWEDKGEFCKIDLQSSWLSHSKLKDVIMRFGEAENIDMRFSDMSEGDFNRVDFKNSDFKKADFSGSNFEGAFFKNASFKGTDFKGSDFPDAEFAGATIDRNQAFLITWLREAGLNIIK